MYKRQILFLQNDVPKLPGTKLAMIADDTAVYTVDRRDETPVIWLQDQLDIR